MARGRVASAGDDRPFALAVGQALAQGGRLAHQADQIRLHLELHLRDKTAHVYPLIQVEQNLGIHVSGFAKGLAIFAGRAELANEIRVKTHQVHSHGQVNDGQRGQGAPPHDRRLGQRLADQRLLVGEGEAAERGVITLKPLQREFEQRRLRAALDRDCPMPVDGGVDRKARPVAQAVDNQIIPQVDPAAQVGEVHGGNYLPDPGFLSCVMRHFQRSSIPNRRREEGRVLINLPFFC